jgi:hypothetical protein
MNVQESDGVIHLTPKLRDNEINALNVAGSRGSKEPEVGAVVRDVLSEAFL